MKLPKAISESKRDRFLKHISLFPSEACFSFILNIIGYVDRIPSCVHVSYYNHLFFAQEVPHVFQKSLLKHKDFVPESFKFFTCIWLIDVDQVKFLVFQSQNSPFQRMVLMSRNVFDYGLRSVRSEDQNPRIARTYFAEVPIWKVLRGKLKFFGLLLERVIVHLGFVDTQPIRLLFLEERHQLVFPDDCPDPIHIPPTHQQLSFRQLPTSSLPQVCCGAMPWLWIDYLSNHLLAKSESVESAAKGNHR